MTGTVAESGTLVDSGSFRSTVGTYCPLISHVFKLKGLAGEQFTVQLSGTWGGSSGHQSALITIAKTGNY
jgi:hypothetical protein